MGWAGIVLSVALLGCSSSEPPAPVSEPTEVSFPADFLWGSATAGFQIESGLSNTDWGIWATLDGTIDDDDKPDDGPDALNHIDADVAAMQQLGLNSYRFSIEMARLYPTRQAFDDDVAADELGYDELLAALDGAAVAPMVTMHHFVWPDYMSDPRQDDDPQGWERSDAVEVFAAYCGRVAARFGDRVDMWVTINEPTVEASVGYFATVFPPGVSDVNRLVGVLAQQLEAHARCYDAIHANDTVDADGDGAAALVSISKHQRVYEPADPSDEIDVAAAEHSRRFWNTWWLDAIVKGDVDDDFDDVIDRHDPGLMGRADYIGLNYYGPSRIDAAAFKQPYMGVAPAQIKLPSGRAKTDLHWDIYPAGFGAVLDEAAGYGLPIHVTENGIADSSDQNRSRFIAEHLFELGKAIARGVDVRGYYHWSLIDNFEWAGGFCPRFGLFRVDFDAAERTRSATAAVAQYTQIIADARLRAADIASLPPYVSAASPCAGF